MTGGWADRDALPRGENGRALCRWCGMEVTAGRLTFCSEWCVNEWKLRSDPGYLRAQVFERDQGVCAKCGIDCIDQYHRLKRLRGASRAKANLEWKLGSRTSLWDADHVVPVAEGGGECDISNMRTLCLRCHRVVTSELRSRLADKKATQIGKASSTK
jgi:5-methylcytosine-specific restriction enzyme A